MPDVTVTRNDDASRYEIHTDGILAGFADFERRPGEIRFTHTEVDHAFQGRGFAQQLASEATADAAASGDAIAAYCPFIASHLEKHPIDGVEVRIPNQG